MQALFVMRYLDKAIMEMILMKQVFFRASKDALDNISRAYDFVHPLTASMRFTRDTLEEASNAKPGLSNADMSALIDPNETVHGVNYKLAFIDTDWNKQEKNIAWLLLNNLFAIHEGWAQRLYEEVFQHCPGYGETAFIKGLESADLENKLHNYYITTPKKSIILEGAFYNVYYGLSKFDYSKLKNYMLCYRFFKEARNCYMHHNFVASQRLLTAYTYYNRVANTTDLNVKEVPLIDTPVLGEAVKPSLRGVIGFSDIIRRIIIVSDAHLLCSKAAEKEFLDRKPNNWKCTPLYTVQSKAQNQITGYSKKLGLLPANWTADYQQFLIANRIFR